MKTSGLRMAATLIVLIGEDAASQVLKFLNESEIEQISKEITKLGPLPADEAKTSVEELYQLVIANPFVSNGGVDYAKRIVERSLSPDSAKRVIERLSSSYINSRAFEAIDKLNPLQLSQFLQNEHPQTIALILTLLTPSSASELLGALPEPMQAEVAVRMAGLETISPDVMRVVSTMLEEKLKAVGTYARNQANGGIRAVAELLNRLDRHQSLAVLEKIDGEKPEMAESIRQLMFIFEDIATLDDPAIREILKRTDKKTIAQALKGASEALRGQFFRNMSQRAVEAMQEEIEIMGPVKARDVHAAKQTIVEGVRKLEKDGIITISAGENDYVI